MSRRSVKLALLAVAVAALAAATLASAEGVRKGNLQVTVTGDLSPKILPRDGTAPIKVTVSGDVDTTDTATPPKMKTMKIELNRNGVIDGGGLPFCPYSSIQPGSSARALSACKASLVGRGSFKAEITLAGQKPYPTGGKMLLFNGKEGGRPVLFGHLYAPRPFATSFVIVFKIIKGKGEFGTALDATLPATLLNWGNLTGIELAISRSYTSHGKKHSYLSASCPTPKGVPTASFPLVRTSFGFSDGRTLSATLNRSCKAR